MHSANLTIDRLTASLFHLESENTDLRNELDEKGSELAHMTDKGQADKRLVNITLLLYKGWASNWQLHFKAKWLWGVDSQKRQLVIGSQIKIMSISYWKSTYNEVNGLLGVAWEWLKINLKPMYLENWKKKRRGGGVCMYNVNNYGALKTIEYERCLGRFNYHCVNVK